MNISSKDLVTLSDLAKELGINKSRLNYYAWLDVLRPVKTVGKIGIYNRSEVIKTLEKIKEGVVRGKTIKEVAKEIMKK